MILTCTECDTSFNFDESMIKPSGSKVRCAKCHSVFTAYPESASAAASVVDVEQSTSGGLDDLDLDAIEKSLDLEVDADEIQPVEEVSDSDELDFDLGLEEDVTGKQAGSDSQFQETQELDLSDFDLDEATDTTGSAAEGGGDLTFDFDEESTGVADADISAPETDTKAISDLDDFDLGLEMESDSEASEVAAGTDEAGAAGGDDLDFSLDLDLDQESAVADAAPSDDALTADTRAMDPGEFDDLLPSDEDADEPGQSQASEIDLDLDEESVTDADESTEELDFDLGLDDDMDIDSDDSTEELDFDLGLDDDEVSGSDAQAAPVLQETEELDLADLEDMVEGEQGAGLDVDEEQSTEDFELDLDLVESAAEEDSGTTATMEETEELDLTGLEDALEPDEGSAELADETGDDLDLELEFDADGEEPAVADALEDDDEGDLELSDFDDMLEIDEEDEELSEASAEGDDYDLELESESDADNADQQEGAMATAAAASAGGGQDEADAFDMGTIDGMDETIDDEAYLDEDEMEFGPGIAAKKGGGVFRRLVKVLVVLIFIVGGGYGAVFLLDFFGIDVPYLDTARDAVRDIEIPYVSDLLGPKDTGNLNIVILEKQLKGSFVDNAALGTLYVVRGKVRNNYKHPRSFINITGKLYAKGGQLKQSKTVFAGNMMPDQRLAAINQAQLTRAENNRNGAKRSNVNIPRGKVVPFMIVFSNLPPNPDEYSIEVAGSAKSK